jgi:anti-sigma factor RsiW
MATVPTVPAPLFRFVCVPAALQGVPAGWAIEMLHDGHVALLPDATGLEGVSAVAHALGTEAVSVIRTEASPVAQDETVMAHTGSLPLVWLAPAFSDAVRTWARDRGPMTLLVEVDGSLPEATRRIVERFIASLGRQAE